MEENQPQDEPASLKRTFTLNDDRGIKLDQGSGNGRGKTVVLVIVLILVLGVGGFFLNKIFHPLSGFSQPTPVTTPASSPSPTESPAPVFNRSDWSFEVLNGTGVTGEAKKVAEKIQALGYSVVKIGNADGGASGTKSNYETTQISVKKDLLEKTDLVVTDLKDAIKIASVAGELTEGTASARIIIGKDSI